MTCERCRGHGEIVNDKGQLDACPECAAAAEREYALEETRKFQPINPRRVVGTNHAAQAAE
jgi:hypothetical protein